MDQYLERLRSRMNILRRLRSDDSLELKDLGAFMEVLLWKEGKLLVARKDHSSLVTSWERKLRGGGSNSSWS